MKQNAHTVDELLERFGTLTEIARQLGVTPGAVWHWQQAKQIPPLRQYQIDALLSRQTAQDRSGSTNTPESGGSRV